MSSFTHTAPASKFYQQDIVRLVQDPDAYGIVLRCWHDAEDISIIDDDPLMRPLLRGEVGVALLGVTGSREIMSESDLVLIDRSLQPGDYVKRSIDDVRSGVVLDIRIRSKLRHVINRQPLQGWKASNEMVPALEAEVGDLVLYHDWVGQIIELCDENIVEVSNGQLVRLPEFGSRFVVGEKGSDILPQGSSMQHILGFFLGNRPSSQQDTVIHVTHTVYAIAWLAINQTLPPNEAQERDRPHRFWWGQDIGKLTLIRNQPDYPVRVGDRVNLIDTSEVPVTIHGTDSQHSEIIHVSTLVVKETETTVHVLWQDGTEEDVAAVALIPYLNADEYDCWPGDHVIWRGDDAKRAGVIQDVDAQRRLATVYFVDTNEKETVSLLELDTHGSFDQDHQLGIDGLGVRIGDYVLIHPEGSTNGFEPPRVPRIGELEAWVRQIPLIDGYLDGWRKEMSELCTDIARKRGTAQIYEQAPMKKSCDGHVQFSWIGKVVKLQTDGAVLVVHPDMTKQAFLLQRLTRLHDGIEQLEDADWDDEHDHDHEYPVVSHEHREWERAMSEGVADDDVDDWVDDDDDPGLPMEVDVDEAGVWAEILPAVTSPISDMNGLASTNTPRTIPDVEVPVKVAIEDEDEESHDHGDLPWKRFDILSSAPVDHAYYSTALSTPSKQFHTRLRKEYRILSTSLPDNIIVRTYEDRADLLRSLIIGPQNTPYEDAPFVIDWMLDWNFPNSPPQAHFLSWTNGNGRVNPNLYEEGKVCLSILGTWAGDQNEIWSSTRSSLLQALVSIQGLVLVKEPWFCEPAYEKLRGTEEGIVNSRLYSEKAYVLSRGFVRRALEIPPGGFEDEIKTIYYTHRRLKKVVDDAKSLIASSEQAEVPLTSSQSAFSDNVPAVPRLTAGGILSLTRTLTRLEALVEAEPHD